MTINSCVMFFEAILGCLGIKSVTKGYKAKYLICSLSYSTLDSSSTDSQIDEFENFKHTGSGKPRV